MPPSCSESWRGGALSEAENLESSTPQRYAQGRATTASASEPIRNTLDRSNLTQQIARTTAEWKTLKLA